MIANLLRMQLLEESDATPHSGTPEEQEKRLTDGRPAWMRTLHSSVSTWLDLVPKVSTVQNYNDQLMPLHRSFLLT